MAGQPITPLTEIRLRRIAERAPTAWIRPAEVMHLFGVTQRTMTRWVADGKMEGTATEGGHTRMPAAAVVKKLDEMRRPA